MANFSTYGTLWQGPTVSWYFGAAAGFVSEMREAIAQWDDLIDIDFVEVGSAAAADVSITFEYIDGAYGVLGEAGGPAQSVNGGPYYYTGDSAIVFDSAETWTWSPSADTYVLGSGTTFSEVALHEMGHILGLGHSTNSSTLMYPNAGGSATDITYWDEVGIHTIYAPEENAPPVASVADQTVAVDQWTRLSTVLSTSDADGDAIVSYEIWDSAGGDNWWADGGIVDASTGYTTGNLSGIWFQGDAFASTQTLWVRANDGSEWSAWDGFRLTSTAASNTPPTASVADQTVGSSQWTRLSTVLSATDPDGDAIVGYEIWDSVGGDNWWADGGTVDANAGYTTADLSGIWFQGDASASNQPLWVRVDDGMAWSAWDSFDLITV